MQGIKKRKTKVLRFLKNGAGNRVRTGDLYLGKVPLYQLSYSRRCLHWRQLKWRPVGESNPCYRRERAVS